MRLGRLNGQEFGKDAGGLPVWHRASQPCRQFHQLGCRLIRADSFQRREGTDHTWITILAAPTKERIGLRLMVHHRALQRCHDLLAVVDRQADLTVEEALPALVNSDFATTNVTEFVLPSIVIVHSTAIDSSPNNATLMDCLDLKDRAA